jgi:hypothetical protein
VPILTACCESITGNSWSHYGRATAPCTASLAATNCPTELRHQLTQVVHGYTGLCEEGAARKGMEWMRAKELDRHHRPTGMVLLLLNDLVGARKQVRQN